MTADMGHTDDPAIQTNDAYLARAKPLVVENAATAPKGTEGVPKYFWSALVKRADMSHALEELLEIPDNSLECFNGVVCRLLNTISHEYTVVVRGPEVHDPKPAVIVASVHHYSVPLAVTANPDWQALMGTHHHLKENGKPTVLLVDLDHAAHVDRIWKPGYVAGIEHTGTPMFIALELSGVDNDNRVDYTRGLDTDSVEDLTEALTTIESHNEILQRAFHGDSGKTFMDNFTKLIVREKTRRKARPRVELYSDPRDLHRAHHDVQSMYWTLLWSFAGALPKGSEAYSKAYLDSFCHFMLTHELGYEGDRLRYLKNDEGCRDFLHDRLRHFGRLFRSLALYFSIPWHVYVPDGTVKIDHAHHAIHRLLLRELIFLRTPDGKKLNLALDTTQLRMYMPKRITDHRQTLIPNQLRTVVATTQGTGAKRKFEQTSMVSQCDAPDAKKAKVGETLAEEPGVEENNEEAQAQPRSANVL